MIIASVKSVSWKGWDSNITLSWRLPLIQLLSPGHLSNYLTSCHHRKSGRYLASIFAGTLSGHLRQNLKLVLCALARPYKDIMTTSRSSRSIYISWNRPLSRRQRKGFKITYFTNSNLLRPYLLVRILRTEHCYAPLRLSPSFLWLLWHSHRLGKWHCKRLERFPESAFFNHP